MKGKRIPRKLKKQGKTIIMKMMKVYKWNYLCQVIYNDIRLSIKVNQNHL